MLLEILYKKIFFYYKKFYSSKNRRIILVLLDLAIINFAFTFFYINNPIYFSENYLSKIIVLTFWISVYFFTGQYKSITSFIGSNSIYFIVFRNIFICIFLLLCQNAFFNNLGSLEKWFSIILFNSFFSGGIRIFLRDLLLSIKYSENEESLSKKVIVYGADINGAQLLKSLSLSKKYKVVGFIDLNKKLWGLEINGVKIFSPERLRIYQKKNTIILLSPTEISLSEKRKIFSNISKYGFSILETPNIEKLELNDTSLSKLRKIEIEDLLFRKPIAPIKKLFGPEIKDQVICVTGAGGSIGSEICKQLIKLNPSKLILIEISELNLYSITKELNTIDSNSKVESILGDVCDKLLIDKIISKYKPSILIHAAAYKHVPLVESNPITGIFNNFISTKVLCTIATKYKVKKMILISSDKAVRPTNVMGASKRLSELILNYFSQLSENKSTLFSMVRFGNVLGSSGSVVNLFKEQIMRGGPITVTHKKIIRYFMTIEEASQLVIQAISLTQGNDLFLLDMGEAINIEKLAKQMIELSGLKLKDKKNPNGNIEIKITELREGEKLFEELLINNSSVETLHPRIFKARDEFIENKDFKKSIIFLEKYLIEKNSKKSLYYLKKLVPEWNRYEKSKLNI